MASYDSGRNGKILFKVMVTVADITKISSVPQTLHTSGNASWAKSHPQSLTKIIGNIHAVPALSVTTKKSHIPSPPPSRWSILLTLLSKDSLVDKTLTWNTAGLSVDSHRDLTLGPGEVIQNASVFRHLTSA